MRLDHDCIREILLYIEKNTTDEFCCVSAQDLRSKLQPKYSEDTINYHVRKIHQACLVDDVFYAENAPQDISCLSWEGHEYIDNIRDNKVWSNVKEKTKTLASASLPILAEYAKKEIFKFLPQ
ncbi:MAG: DUF2513 domain-containing protein [Bacillota bacterium]|nr:DUF2513 domain-containing protein [Bacillota bacterium]